MPPLRALEKLTSVRFTPAPPRALPQLEDHLLMLARSQAGGRTLRLMALSARELQRANRLLSAIDPAQLCRRGRPSQRARYLRNLVDHIWGPKVQAALARDDRQQRNLEQGLRRLLDIQPVTVPRYDAWMNHYFGKNSIKKQKDRRLKKHVELWQRLFRKCNLMPGSGT